MSIKTSQRGDTIIEVILAMTLLSMIIFIAWGTTNRATQISTNARKRVTMVNALKEQAEIIQSKYKAASGNTDSIAVDYSVSASSSANLATDPCQNANMATANTAIAGGFYYKTDLSDVTEPQVNKYAKVGGDDDSRVWVQYVNDVNQKYVDFYVRGCWLTSGGSQRYDNSQFIVRLNK